MLQPLQNENNSTAQKAINPYDIITNEQNYLLSTDESNYSLFSELISLFLTKNFKHVSFCLKGFRDIHNKCLSFNLPITNHYLKGKVKKVISCEYCSQKVKEDEVIMTTKKELSQLNAIDLIDDIEYYNTDDQLKEEGSVFDTISNILKGDHYLSNRVRKHSLKSKYKKIYEMIESSIYTEFPSKSKLSKDEVIVECLTWNMLSNKIIQITVYFYNSYLSFFLKSGEDYIPIELNIHVSSIISVKRELDININDMILNNNTIMNKKVDTYLLMLRSRLNTAFNKLENIEVFDDEFDYESTTHNYKSYRYALIFTFLSSLTNDVSEMSLFFDSVISLERFEHMVCIFN